MKMILLEAITQTGGISADWVLVTLVGAFFALVGWVLVNIRNDLKAGIASLTATSKEHEEWLRIHDNKIIEQRGDIDHHRELYDQHLQTFHKTTSYGSR